MPFDPVDPKQSLPNLEKGILRYWKEEAIFERSITNRISGSGERLEGEFIQESENLFSFYDGPPFATGTPHYGHFVPGTVKDVIPRYQTMRGKVIQRRFGWDCHGLPVENLVEKEHKLQSKKDIENLGTEQFNKLCRESVLRYTKEWRDVVERMGRWVDMDWDYRTMDPDYMESVWWIFAELHRKKLVYEGHKPMHICPRCVTPLSNFEVTQGYKDITDQSVTVKFQITNHKSQTNSKSKTYLLAWTTTPWTLPGNLFLAVHPNIEYVRFQRKDDPALYIASKKAVSEKRLADSTEIVGKPFLGKDLIEQTTYEPLFPYFTDQYGGTAFRVVAGDFVSTDEGTGIVHIAPGFGEDDFQIGKRENVELLQHVTPEGTFVKEVQDFAGLDVKPSDDPSKTDRKIISWLKENGKLFENKSYRHSYPHCWRCDTPLLNYATSSWFVAVEQIKDRLLKNNAKTRWVPGHIRDGRFGKWLENVRDWAVSRKRYWGTPLPIWRQDTETGIEIISSRDELMAKQKIRFTKLTTVRHGESEGNLYPPFYQGQVPGTDLTKRGRKQAEAAGEWIVKESVHPVDIIYCSPLARTKQTAEGIAKATGAKIIVDDRIREAHFGEYERKVVDFSDLQFTKERRAKKIEEGRPESIYHLPGMESWESVQGRINDFLEDILPKHRSDHVVVVTHADPVKHVQHFFTKEDPVKISHQPFPYYASPRSYYWDHKRQEAMDLHKETVDTVVWLGDQAENSVHLTITRHGETDWNVEGRSQGHKDNPLNATGKEQAQKLAESLSGQTFDVVLSSDLKRAKETAAAVTKKLDIETREEWKELRERHTGDWEGMFVPDILKKFPHGYASKTTTFHYITPPNGESLDALLDRAWNVYNMILERYAGKRVLLVGHNGINRALRTIIENRTYAEGVAASMENTETVELTLNPLMRRIPEVFDCWFESGSMPYAQQHFPFRHDPNPDSKPGPAGFPADFIAESLDQTRGWFYTLMVLSTALFDKPAFDTCVTNGIVLAEDGKKMSKRLRNFPEPTKVMELHGADAMRFYLMNSPVIRGEDIRFSEKGVEEVVRSVLLPFWNSYHLFVTYANIAQLETIDTRAHSSHPLDQWIRSEIQDLTNHMTEQLDAYDLSGSCGQIRETIDSLTNWYIRLSRRRFAGKEGEQQQRAALHTLGDVLLSLCQLLAPICPFITDAMYINLIPEEHTSIHLADWPEVRKLTKEEVHLLQKHRTLRKITSLGLKIRSEQKIKNRQPLRLAHIALPPEYGKLNDEDLHLLQQELNVKDVEITDDPETLATAYVQVDARKVGPRLGKRVQEIIEAGKRGEFEFRDDGSVQILDEHLSPQEVRVAYHGKDGAGIAADFGIVVRLDCDISSELRLEGIARDIIRNVQRLRKENGLHPQDHIALSIEGADDVLKQHAPSIEKETNASLGTIKKAQARDTMKFDDMEVAIAFQKQ